MSAAPDLFAAGAEQRADHLWPGERIRRGARTLRIERVEVTHGEQTVLDVRTLTGTSERLALPAAEIVRVVS